MNRNYLDKIFLLLLLPFLVLAQVDFRVVKIEGTVKVQKSGQKSWKDVGKGDDLGSNDILETFFKSKVTLQYGTENVIIVGPNTKLLLKAEEFKGESGKKNSASFTVFNGGILATANSSFPISIYTSTGVMEVDSGTVTTIVESKTGNTGIQILGGSAKIKNVTSQKYKKLGLGMTSIILSGKDPSAPLYITYRHVSVLKQFFGEKYVERQIEVSGIKPTEDASSSHLKISNETKGKMEQDGSFQKRLFVKNNVWGAIVENEKKVIDHFEPISLPYRITDKKGELYFRSSFGMTNGVTYPRFQLITSIYGKKFSAGLNLPIAKNSSQNMSMNFSGADGVIEKIDHITIGSVKKKRFLMIAPIEEYTIGRGLVVNDFRNKNIYTVTQPLGLRVQLSKNQVTNLEAFIADISSWKVGGIHLGIDIGNTWLSMGYYYDGNQLENKVTTKNSRFLQLENWEGFELLDPGVPSSAHIIELGIGYKFIFDKYMRFLFLMQFAGKTEFDDRRNGYVFDGPELNFSYKQTTFGLGYVQQTGKLLFNHFGASYMSNRQHHYDFNFADSTMEVTTYDMLDDKFAEVPPESLAVNSRTAYGLKYFVKSTPVRGLSIEFDFYHDFINRRQHAYQYLEGAVGDSSYTYKNPNYTIKKGINFSYNLSVSINEKLTKFIKYGTIYVRQENAALFPATGKIFASWGFEAGLKLMSAPLIANLALDLGYVFSYIDMADEYGNVGFQNNSIDAGDNLSEFYFGIRWGFSKKQR